LMPRAAAKTALHGSQIDVPDGAGAFTAPRIPAWWIPNLFTKSRTAIIIDTEHNEAAAWLKAGDIGPSYGNNSVIPYSDRYGIDRF
jgi:hypothetical protein